MLKEELEEGFILQTNYQRKGKGQGTNSWESEPGKNLLFSMLFYPDFLAPAKQFLLSKAVAIAIVEVFNQIKNGFHIKWPNDIYYGEKKVAGILIETAIMGNKLKHAIVGMGINANQEIFHEAPNPVSLKQILHADTDIGNLLHSLEKSLWKQYQFLKSGRTTELNQQYSKYLFRRDGIWPFKDENGVFYASIENVEEEGQLILKTTSGEFRQYWMKEVEFVL